MRLAATGALSNLFRFRASRGAQMFATLAGDAKAGAETAAAGQCLVKGYLTLALPLREKALPLTEVAL
jgi:hypothetical protein